MRLTLLLLLLTLSQAVAAPRLHDLKPTDFPSDLIGDLVRLRDEALKSDYAYEQLTWLCNHIGPRLSGSPGAEAAVDYVAGEMRRLGLRVELEELEVPHWVRGEERAEVVSYPGQVKNLPSHLALTALGGSVATPPEGLTAEVLVVDSFDDLKRHAGEARGRIVLFNAPFDERLAAGGQGLMAYAQAARYRVDGASAAATLGAVACFVRSAGGGAYRLPHTGMLDYDKDQPRIPAAALAVEDAMLLAELSRHGPVRVHLVLSPHELPPVRSYNVIADLVGSEHPEQVVVVSGHLDSWDLATGATDDGAGVVMAMETAHLLVKLGLKPRRTLRVIAWMNEENGMVGGRTYARNHADAADTHFAVIESDLGAGHPLGIAFKGDASIGELLEPLTEVLGPVGATLLRPTEHAGSDIGPVTRMGVPGFTPIQDDRVYFDYHHTAADTLDKVDPVNLRENCAVMAVLACTLTRL